MGESLSILLVEDDEDDYLITREYLEEIPGRRVELRWVDCYDEALALAESGGFDICLVDYRMGGHTGLEFLERAKAKALQVPMVLLTGVGQRDIDVAATEAGAADFLDKSELSSTILDRTIRYAIANAAARRALAEKTGFLETTLENTGAGIAAFDSAGVLTMANGLFSDFVKRFDADRDPATDEEPLDLATLERLLGVTLEDSLPLAAPCGHSFELRRNAVPSGGFVLFVLDVTEQKALEEKMIEARNDAESASRAKSAFLANISHELRTPLHSIIGYSELILAGTKALDPKDCAGQIHESGTHLLSLIESVIAFSKLESGEYTCRIDRIFEIEGLIKASIDQTAVAASQRNVTIESNLDPSIESLYGDQMALRQMLVNLLKNAIEFSEEDGQIDVRLDLLDDGGAVLSVEDRGMGMEPDTVDRVFSPFVQLDNSLDRSHEGTGLGLPIVKSLAAHHDAEVRIETAPGKGTKVMIVFPSDTIIKHGEEPTRVIL